MITLCRGSYRLIVARKLDGKGWIFAITAPTGIIPTPDNGPFESRRDALKAGVRSLITAGGIS